MYSYGLRRIGVSVAANSLVFCKRSFPIGGQSLQCLSSRNDCRMFSSSSGSNDKDKKETKEKIADGVSKVKQMWTKYGTVFIGTYLGVYVTTLGSLFLALDYDIFNASMVGLDPVAAVSKVLLVLISVV